MARVEFGPLDRAAVVPFLFDVASVDRDACGLGAAARVILRGPYGVVRMKAGARIAWQPESGD
jgi:hypothetical protein